MLVIGDSRKQEFPQKNLSLQNREPGSSGESTGLPPIKCGPRSIPGSDIICGLLVLYSAPRGFSAGTPVFPSHQKPTFDLI